VYDKETALLLLPDLGPAPWQLSQLSEKLPYEGGVARLKVIRLKFC